jgi:hypothetical protein
MRPHLGKPINILQSSSGSVRVLHLHCFQLRFLTDIGNTKLRIFNSFKDVSTNPAVLKRNEARAQSWNPNQKEQDAEFDISVMSAVKSAMGNDMNVYVHDDDGIHFVDQKAAVRALQKSAKEGSSWVKLATALDESVLKPPSGELTEVVNGIQYNSAGCLLEAVTVDPRNSHYWLLLGERLGRGERTLPHLSPYSAADCFAKALSLNPRPETWLVLGHFLNNNSVTIHGKQYTRIQCYVESLQLDASGFFGWDFLSHALYEQGANPPTVTINGNVYTAFESRA